MNTKGAAMTANPRVTRCTITLAMYVALQLGSVVVGIAISHKPAATSGNVMALADAPKLPIDITEAF
jgi:flagellar biosynthesis protein FliQ